MHESAMKLIQFYLITEHVIWHSNLKHIKWCLNYLFCAWVWFTREWFLINVSIRWSDFLVHLIMKSCWRVSPLNRHGGPHPPSADIASHSITALINQPSSPPWKRLYVTYYITENALTGPYAFLTWTLEALAQLQNQFFSKTTLKSAFILKRDTLIFIITSISKMC